MQCDLITIKLCVCLSVLLSKHVICDKKKLVPTFLYHMKEHLSIVL